MNDTVKEDPPLCPAYGKTHTFRIKTQTYISRKLTRNPHITFNKIAHYI